jgi:hypothetical protein
MKAIETNFLGQQFTTEEIPVLWCEITAANIDFDFDIPVSVRKQKEADGIWSSYDCKKAIVHWHPGFDFEAGMVQVNPETLYIDGTIINSVLDESTDEDKEIEIEVNRESKIKITSVDDGADRQRQYGPHSVEFVINDKNEVTEATVFYS